MNSQLTNREGRTVEGVEPFPSGKLFWVDQADKIVLLMAGNRIVEIMANEPTMRQHMELFVTTLNEIAEEWATIVWRKSGGNK